MTKITGCWGDWPDELKAVALQLGCADGSEVTILRSAVRYCRDEPGPSGWVYVGLDSGAELKVDISYLGFLAWWLEGEMDL